MLIQHFNVEADRLLAGKRVQVAADRVHLARDALRRSGLGAREHHVLHKCEMPFSSAISCREPARTHTPIATERTFSIRSVRMVNPFGRTVRSTLRSFTIISPARSVAADTSPRKARTCHSADAGASDPHIPRKNALCLPVAGLLSRCRLIPEFRQSLCLNHHPGQRGELLHFRLSRAGIGSDCCPIYGATAIRPFV